MHAGGADNAVRGESLPGLAEEETVVRPQYTATCRVCGKPYPCFGEVPPSAAKLECWDCTQTRRFFEERLRFDASGVVGNLPATEDAA